MQPLTAAAVTAAAGGACGFGCLLLYSMALLATTMYMYDTFIRDFPLW